MLKNVKIIRYNIAKINIILKIMALLLTIIIKYDIIIKSSFRKEVYFHEWKNRNYGSN